MTCALLRFGSEEMSDSQFPVEPEARTVVSSERQLSFKMDQQTLLYVEDEPEALKLFESAAQQCRAGFSLQVATGLETAFDCLGKQPRPMAVLLDYKLGKFKGSDLLRWMRGRPDLAPIEVAVLGELDSEKQINDCYSAGADYYLVKPGDSAGLTDIVERIDRGFQHPSKNLFLYHLVLCPAYREPVITPVMRAAMRRREGRP